MVKGRMLSLEERKHIEQGIREKKSLQTIADGLKRAYSTIFYEVRRAGGKDVYFAEHAHDHSVSKRVQSISEFRAMASARDRHVNAGPRLKSLEMQVQILSDTLKELVNAKNK